MRGTTTSISPALLAAFSTALSHWYTATSPETRAESMLPLLKQIFQGADVSIEVCPNPVPDKSIESMIIPIKPTTLSVSIRRAGGFEVFEEDLAAHLRSHLSEGGFSSASWDETLPVEQRLTALDPQRFSPLGLTRRECEVLHWVEIGKRDAQIAAIIGAARRTVNKHVENILRKLGAETRMVALHIAADRLKSHATEASLKRDLSSR